MFCALDMFPAQGWHMVTVAEEMERALQLSRGNVNSGLPPIFQPGTSSPCGPPNPSETSGPSMSPDHIGPLRVSPAFSLNSSHSLSDSLTKVKIEAANVEVKEPRGHQEDTSTELGLFFHTP